MSDVKINSSDSLTCVGRPFRLTRMMIHAMEVSGIEGSFRNTSEISMQVLRDNKESLMAVLEALVYDPLINWRLLQDKDMEEGRLGDFEPLSSTSTNSKK